MSKKKLSKEEKEYKKKIKEGRLAKREAMTGFLFVSPWIVGACIFLFYPLITSFWYALNNIRITPVGKSFTFVGQGNFTQILLSDADFPAQMLDYLTSTLIAIPIIIVFALLIAMMLNQKFRFKGIFRLLFFFPVIIVSGPVMSMLSQDGAVTITSVDTQAIETAIEAFMPPYLASLVSEVFANMIMILWYSGVQILIFLSGLQKVDRSMYEAAKIDGGSSWECFWKITLPNIKPLILLNCIYTIVFISGNEQNEIITLIKSSMFSGTKEKGYGYASAMAWIYSLAVVLIVIVFAGLLAGRKDVYERRVKKVRKERKREKRAEKRIERRSAGNAKKIERARKKSKYSSYNSTKDY